MSSNITSKGSFLFFAISFLDMYSQRCEANLSFVIPPLDNRFLRGRQLDSIVWVFAHVSGST